MRLDLNIAFTRIHDNAIYIILNRVSRSQACEQTAILFRELVHEASQLRKTYSEVN